MSDDPIPPRAGEPAPASAGSGEFSVAAVGLAEGIASLPATPEPLSAEALAARALARRNQRIRLGALGVLFVGLLGLGYALGLDEYLDRERIRALVEGWGALGPLAFVVLFALGELVHVPAWVFIGAGVVVWGPYVGGVIGFVGANVSVNFAFLLVRGIGGKALDAVERPLVRRLLARLDEYPLLVVAALRALFFALPALNYGLALTRIRYRDYALGSALGLVVPTIVLTVGFAFALG